jgi:hypothetical protein
MDSVFEVFMIAVYTWLFCVIAMTVMVALFVFYFFRWKKEKKKERDTGHFDGQNHTLFGLSPEKKFLALKERRQEKLVWLLAILAALVLFFGPAFVFPAQAQDVILVDSNPVERGHLSIKADGQVFIVSDSDIVRKIFSEEDLPRELAEKMRPKLNNAPLILKKDCDCIEFARPEDQDEYNILQAQYYNE